MSWFAGTRALAHWAWRMFLRDWRGQSLVLVLVTVAVAVSSYGGALGHALAPTDQATFGSANARIRFTTADRSVAATVVSAARSRLSAVEEITDALASVPGSVRQLDLRTQNPNGAFGSSTLQLRSGRYPTSDGEIALAAGTSAVLTERVGASLTLGGVDRRVVGVVENPAQLDDAFGVVVAMPPGNVRYTLLVDAPADQLAAFRAGQHVPGGVAIDTPTRNSRDLGVLLVATLGMILVAVLALTAFLVLAQRRVRQLGMLAAIGATRRQVRRVTVIHGLIIGVIAAVVGTVAAAAGWALTSSLIARVSGRRVSWGSVPLWLIVTPGVMGIVASTLAAWWPARTMARVPVVRALSNRPLDAPQGRRSAFAALAALLVGVVCLRLAHQHNAFLMIIGLVATIAAILFSAPLALRLLTGRGARLPIARRLAWRELGRNLTRSAAALATVTMAVGIAAAAVVITAANTHPPTAGNLSDRQILIPATDTRDPAVTPPRTADQTNALDAAAAKVAATLPKATFIPLSLAVDPAAQRSPIAQATGGLDAAQVVRRLGGQVRTFPLYVANHNSSPCSDSTPTKSTSTATSRPTQPGPGRSCTRNAEPCPRPRRYTPRATHPCLRSSSAPPSQPPSTGRWSAPGGSFRTRPPSPPRSSEQPAPAPQGLDSRSKSATRRPTWVGSA
jgi:putative ABC transport system permease protein